MEKKRTLIAIGILVIFLILILFVLYRFGKFPITGFFVAGGSGKNNSSSSFLENVSDGETNLSSPGSSGIIITEGNPLINNLPLENNITNSSNKTSNKGGGGGGGGRGGGGRGSGGGNSGGNNSNGNESGGNNGGGNGGDNNSSNPKNKDFEISLISPVKNSLGMGNMTFYYNVSYDGEIDYCELFIDNQNFVRSYNVEIGSVGNLSANNLDPGKHFWEIECRSKDGKSASSEKRKINIFFMPFGFEFPGDLDNIDLGRVENLFFKKKGFGEIRFIGVINLSDIENLDKHLFIGKNFIRIDSDYLPQLDRPAILTFEGLRFQNPVIIRNGQICPEEECKIISYNDGNLIFNVTHFSNYSAIGAGGEPNGAQVDPGTSEGATANQTADSADAYAGNVTELNIFSDGITASWQGYFGEVSGVIRLANAAGNTMYNWSLANPRGEVYATIAGSVNWGDITCFNMAAGEAALETAFGIASSDGDGVGETFSSVYGQELFTNNIDVSATGECRSVELFGDEGVPTFSEVILTADGGTTPIFAGILENNATGFDGNSYDFEMLVLDNGHAGDTDPTAYNFYVEIS